MEREKAMNGFLGEVFQAGIYKRSQGRVTRQLTFAALALAVAIGAWRLSTYTLGNGPVFQFLLPGLLLFGGGWLCFRAVNYPRFADFLIAVELEVRKVSWPNRTELIRSAIVVIGMIFGMGFMLFGVDLFWRELLQLVGVMR